MCSGMTFGGHHPPANYVPCFLHQRHAEQISDGGLGDPLIVSWSARNRISCDFEEYISDLEALSEPAACLLFGVPFMAMGIGPWHQAAFH